MISACLVGSEMCIRDSSGLSEEIAFEHLDELEFLATTAGALTKKQFLQKLSVPNPKTYVGTGKLNEIKEYIGLHHIDLVIFDLSLIHI